jgi:hypothetical protein
MDKNRFIQAITLLQGALNFSLSPDVLKVWAIVLKEELTDDELERSVILAIKHYNHQPTPQQLVELVRGTVRQRAIQEWIDDEYSMVGRTALDAIGGRQAKQTSQQPDKLLEKFIEVYVAIAQKSPPSATRRTQPRVLPVLESGDSKEVERLLAIFRETVEKPVLHS